MTAIEINAEIYRNLGYLADSEDYLKTVLSFLKKLSLKKRNSMAKAEPIKKFKVDMNRPSEMDKFKGMLTSSREDDEKAREDYMKEKYGRYL